MECYLFSGTNMIVGPVEEATVLPKSAVRIAKEDPMSGSIAKNHGHPASERLASPCCVHRLFMF